MCSLLLRTLPSRSCAGRRPWWTWRDSRVGRRRPVWSSRRGRSLGTPAGNPDGAHPSAESAGAPSRATLPELATTWIPGKDTRRALASGKTKKNHWNALNAVNFGQRRIRTWRRKSRRRLRRWCTRCCWRAGGTRRAAWRRWSRTGRSRRWIRPATPRTRPCRARNRSRWAETSSCPSVIQWEDPGTSFYEAYSFQYLILWTRYRNLASTFKKKFEEKKTDQFWDLTVIFSMEMVLS